MLLDFATTLYLSSSMSTVHRHAQISLYLVYLAVVSFATSDSKIEH